jgi:hypothetical protein
MLRLSLHLKYQTVRSQKHGILRACLLRFEVLAAVLMKIPVFEEMMLFL